MNTTDTPPTTIPEIAAAEKLGLPRARPRDWRKDGSLEEGEHYVKEGGSYCLTDEGVARLADLAGLPETRLADLLDRPPTVMMRVSRKQGQNPRTLRCLRLEEDHPLGPVVVVKLMTPRLNHKMFKPGTDIAVVPTETPDIFEYHGAKPKVTRL